MLTPNRRAFVLIVGIGLSLPMAGATTGEGETDAWMLIERAIEREGAMAGFEQVLTHMRGVDTVRSGVAHRLSCVRKGLAEPWSPPAQSAELKQALSAPYFAKENCFSGLNGDVATWLDVDDYAIEKASPEHPGLAEMRDLWGEIANPECAGMELLQNLSDYLALAHAIIDETLMEYSDDELALLFGGYEPFYEAWYRNHFPGATLSAEQNGSIEQYRGLLRARKANRALLLGVADGVLQLAEPAFQKTLARRLAKVRSDASLPKDVLAIVGEEPSNRVVLSGRKSSTHKEAAALVIDLGGDDTYTTAAVVNSPDQLVSVVIDLAGNDSYKSDTPGPAFAVGGIALLSDRKGNDSYVSKRLGQAASVMGYAALIDFDGDDRYVAEDYAQGHGCGGVALLYDRAGNDTYTAWAFAQAGGIGGGLSALVDGAGDDEYLADLHWPDVDGNSGPDVFHGASQGYCTGIRSDVAGGVAALLDLGEGKDRYQSGSFSQGGGYYFSFGLMYDGGGDDENFGSRYSQGFGVHQGIGVRWDAGGDDRYTCRSVAHTGMAWDEGVGYLIEDGGDDVYRTGDLSCGGAAQTGIAIHIDRDGSDTYKTGRQSQGGTGSSNYHNKPSVGVLIDLGGGSDTYSAEGREDMSVRVTESLEVFLDMRAQDFKRALKSKLLK